MLFSTRHLRDTLGKRQHLVAILMLEERFGDGFAPVVKQGHEFLICLNNPTQPANPKNTFPHPSLSFLLPHMFNFPF